MGAYPVTADAKDELDYRDFTFDMFIGSVDGEESEAVRFSRWVDAGNRDRVNSFEAVRLGAQRPELDVRRADGVGLHFLNFSSYNYLGYAAHPEVIEAAKRALDQFGLGACGSPVQAGTLDLHSKLEQRLIDLVGLPNRGISLFSSGYAVNTGTISALMQRRHHIVVDKSAHMSIIEGAQLARSHLHFFEHNDANHLETILKEIAPGAERILVCTEGVFSVDGDFGALDRIVPMAKSYGAQVLVDEAHSFLLCGERGCGVAEQQGVLDQVDYLVVTFSKALGGVGGALIAQHEIARYVNFFARCRAFSCALDPAVTAGVTRGLELGGGSDGRQRRERLHRNGALLREGLGAHVDIGRSQSWIVPVIFGADRLGVPLADWLQRHGLDGSIMMFPAVAVDEGRVRLFVSSEHTEAQIAECVGTIRRAATEFGFLRQTAS